MGFLDQLKSITDIFNLGRLVFYPFAGALVVVPFYLAARMVVVSPVAPLLFTQVSQDLASMGRSSWSLAIFVLGSVAVGFLVAVVGFTEVIRHAGDEIRGAGEHPPADRTDSITFNYPLLRNKVDEDYASWLISEYFRYAEIATFIPMGAMAGLMLTTLYVAIYVVRQVAEATPGGSSSAYVALALLLCVVIVCKWYLWPEVWFKRVIVPIVRIYVNAKISLIEGVTAVDRKVIPFAPRAARPAASPSAEPPG